MADGLSIKEVAEQTGLAPGTIRMWEQRYGFPDPRRTASGYRRYEPEDVETLRRARAHRQRGLSVSAALERARETAGDVGPSVDLRRGGGHRPRRAGAGAAQVDADRALAGDRARAAGPRGRAGALRRLPARALLPRARAALAADGAPRRRGHRVRRLRDAAPAVGRAGRGADRRGRGARQRVGGHRRRPRLRGVPAGLGAARRDRARGPGRPRSALRGDLDHRSAGDAARRAGGGAAGRQRRSRLWPSARGAAGRSPAGHGAAGARAHGADQPHAGLRRGRRARRARRRPGRRGAPSPRRRSRWRSRRRPASS